MTTPQAPVVICMGSQSDWDTMQEAATILEELGIGFESRIISAHRTPGRLSDFASTAAADGVKVIIAGAGGAAHLPGMLAANTRLPVLGVPVESKYLKGMDSLLSIVQMPGGVPVGTLAIGKPGAKNAGLMAAQILAIGDSDIAGRLDSWREAQTLSVWPKHPHDNVPLHRHPWQWPAGPHAGNCRRTAWHRHPHLCPRRRGKPGRISGQPLDRGGL